MGLSEGMIIPHYLQSRISRRTVSNIQNISLTRELHIHNANMYLESLQLFGIQFGLERIQRMCQLSGNPQDQYPSILIGGTNGKGSTAAFLDSILQARGLKTGLFTSPHLTSPLERIQINREYIPIIRMTSYINDQKRIAQENGIDLTYFEFMTSIAFRYFMDENIDIGVFEVGLGGRFDATNVLKSLITCITHIHYDHTNYLGNTLKAIALEKAGIVKRNGFFVHAEKRESIKKIFKQICMRNNTQYVDALLHTNVHCKFKSPYIIADFETPCGCYPSMKIPLLGFHQLNNALLAIRIAEELANFGIVLDTAVIKSGIENTAWNCRLEIVHEKPLALLDSAHNVEGIQRVLEFVDFLRTKKIIVVFGVLKDKQWKKMVKLVDYYADEIILTEPVSDRALPPGNFSNLRLSSHCHIIKDPLEAYKNALQSADDDSLILVTGSMYLVGYIKKHIRSLSG